MDGFNLQIFKIEKNYKIFFNFDSKSKVLVILFIFLICMTLKSVNIRLNFKVVYLGLLRGKRVNLFNKIRPATDAGFGGKQNKTTRNKGRGLKIATLGKPPGDVLV